jgi:hypothetical protein
MNLKRNVFSLVCAAVLSIGSTVYGQSIVELVDDASLYTQTEKGYILKFNVLADADEMNLIKGKVDGLASRLSMEVVSHVNGKYNVVFTVDHQNHAMYVYKMMTSCGFKSIKYKGQNLELSKIVEILESYQ